MPERGCRLLGNSEGLESEGKGKEVVRKEDDGQEDRMEAARRRDLEEYDRAEWKVWRKTWIASIGGDTSTTPVPNSADTKGRRRPDFLYYDTDRQIAADIAESERMLVEIEAEERRVRRHLEELQKLKARTSQFIQERQVALAEESRRKKPVQQQSTAVTAPKGGTAAGAPLMQRTTGIGTGSGAGAGAGSSKAGAGTPHVAADPPCPVPGLEHLWKMDPYGHWSIQGDYKSLPKGANSEEKRKWYEVRGMHMNCARCTALNRPCDHDRFCGECFAAGADCEWVECPEGLQCPKADLCQLLHAHGVQCWVAQGVDVRKVRDWAFPDDAVMGVSWGTTDRVRRGSMGGRPKQRDEYPLRGIGVHIDRHPNGFATQYAEEWIMKKFYPATWADSAARKQVEEFWDEERGSKK